MVAFPEFMERVAEVDFHNTKSDGSTFVCKVHYFFVSEWLGRPQSRPKEFMINPRWFPKDHLHYEMMMPADKDFMTVLFQEDMKHWFMKAQAFLGPFQAEKLKPTEIQWVER